MRGEDERARAEEAGQPVHADLPHLGPFLLASVSTHLSRPSSQRVWLSPDRLRRRRQVDCGRGA
jgi:hypothetical protein